MLAVRSSLLNHCVQAPVPRENMAPEAGVYAWCTPDWSGQERVIACGVTLTSTSPSPKLGLRLFAMLGDLGLLMLQDAKTCTT